MATFDVKTYAAAAGQQGTSLPTSIGMGFGLPSCMLNLADQALSILPSELLFELQEKIKEAMRKGQDQARGIAKEALILLGFIEYDTETGRLKFKANIGGLDLDTGFAEAIGNIIEGISYITGLVSEAIEIYENIKDEIESIIACFKSLKSSDEFQSRNSNPAALTGYTPEAAYAPLRIEMNTLVDFIEKCDKQIKVIDQILLDRENDPSLEPCFPAGAEFDPFFSGTLFKRCTPEDPGLTEDVFRLTYGPPVTSKGQYILTSDGLYYDSQSGGLDPIYLAISGIIPPGEAWKYNFDPNLGGKGDAVSIQSLNKFTDNIFDPTLIDDSKSLQEHYNEDHFLAVLNQQRDKHIFDLSSNLDELIDVYTEDSSIVKNQRQLIISEIANHNSKINKRKKQIEIAIKIPKIYGNVDTPLFGLGQIPINDFSYLEEYNLIVDLEKQKALVFAQSEVTGIVLPLNPKYVTSSQKPDSLEYTHLYVPNIGKGSILYTPSSLNAGAVLSLNDQIHTDNLFAIYNFLDSNIALPSSTSYITANCATHNRYNDGQLVAPNKNDIFPSGLAIPYFEGIVKNKEHFPAGASAMGTYFRLPDTPEFRDLTYRQDGFTMECWVHVPNIMDGELGWLSGTTSSLTKVLLGCENVGIIETKQNTLNHLGEIADLDYLPNDKGEQNVRGLLCGFTRDRRITQEGTGYSNNNFDNDPASSLSFFLCPTISRDLSSASFISTDDCASELSFRKMKVDLSATQIGNVSSQFVLIDISVDPRKDKISFFADGSLITTSSISSVFGTEFNQPLNLPTFKKNNSFEYNSSSVDGPNTLKTGPKLNPYFTPWIVGGGYTDGMYQYGNFMGGDRGGIVSGLRGHVGSLKFYNKPLNSSEVLKNYKAQEGFFKTILI